MSYEMSCPNCGQGIIFTNYGGIWKDFRYSWPDCYGSYLVNIRKGGIMIADYSEIANSFIDPFGDDPLQPLEDVTHWQPRPDPPEVTDD